MKSGFFWLSEKFGCQEKNYGTPEKIFAQAPRFLSAALDLTIQADEFILPYFVNENLYVVATFSKYRARTVKFRKSSIFLLAFVSPHAPISNQTVSKVYCDLIACITLETLSPFASKRINFRCRRMWCTS